MLVLLFLFSLLAAKSIQDDFETFYQEKVDYNYSQEYIKNLVLNLCAISKDSKEVDIEFVQLFLNNLEKSPFTGLFDNIIKPKLDRQRIFDYVKKEFLAFVKVQTHNVVMDRLNSKPIAQKAQKSIGQQLENFLENNEFFDIWNHYGLFRPFVGDNLLNKIEAEIDKY